MSYGVIMSVNRARWEGHERPDWRGRWARTGSKGGKRGCP